MKSIAIGAAGAFQIVQIDAKTGKTSDAVTIQASKALDHKALGQIVSAVVKSAGTRRDAWLSLLGLVFVSPRLDGFKGQGDRATGKVSKEFKAAVRDAEGDTIRMLVAEGAIKLAKGEPEKVTQEFLSELREDKNYSNVKVTANRYFALVGANVVTAEGYLMPVEVMQAQIAAVVDKEPEDNSIAAKLRGVMESMSKDTIDSADAIDSLSLCRTLMATLQGIVTEYASIRTNAGVAPVGVTPKGIVAQAAAVLDKASTTPAPVLTAAAFPEVAAGKAVKTGFGDRLAAKRAAETVAAPF